MHKDYDIYTIVLNKIDIYMREYIIPIINPSKVYWWFSLSGGKDSFVMAHGINEWYKRNHYSFHGEGFCIRQWSSNTFYTLVKEQISWMPVTIIDGVESTKSTTKYTLGNQAPCNTCSLIRKQIGDSFIITNYKNGYTNIIARGLHLSDMAISYLWRVFWNIDTISFAQKLEKGNPLVKLNLYPAVYLSKPLCYLREYETQEYSRFIGFKPICCGCPACRFPSRRDIVEESLKRLLPQGKWEFSVYGINEYLKKIGRGVDIEGISLAGIETKRNQIPLDYFDYTVEKFRGMLRCYNYSSHYFLDDIGIEYIVNHTTNDSDTLLFPKLFSDCSLSLPEKCMIATVGPFWGGIGYKNKLLHYYLMELQREKIGMHVDFLWSQVIPLLNEYYSNKHYNISACCSCGVS